jgi:integrase
VAWIRRNRFDQLRWAALSDGLLGSIEEWKKLSLNASDDAWVFPSEPRTTPLSRDNCWRRRFLLKLLPVGLGWANFQVMRRTHSSLLDDLGVDPQVRAEQMGHTIDVNENVYTASFGRRQQAVNDLEKGIDVM